MKYFNYCDPDLLRAMNNPSKHQQQHSPRSGHRTPKSPAHSRAQSPTPAPSESGAEIGEDEDVKPLVGLGVCVWCWDRYLSFLCGSLLSFKGVSNVPWNIKVKLINYTNIKVKLINYTNIIIDEKFALLTPILEWELLQEV